MEINLYFVQVWISWQWLYFDCGKQYKEILKVVVFIILKVLAHPMILPTWIRFEAFRLSRTTVSSSSWLLPFNEVGVLTFTSLMAKHIYVHNNNSHICHEKTCHLWVRWVSLWSVDRTQIARNWHWRKTLGVISVGLRSVEAPWQQCYRKSRRRHEHINIMIVRTCTALCFNSKCQGM